MNLRTQQATYVLAKVKTMMLSAQMQDWQVNHSRLRTFSLMLLVSRIIYSEERVIVTTQRL